MKRNKRDEEKKTNQGSLNCTHWILSISAVFESLPLSPSRDQIRQKARFLKRLHWMNDRERQRSSEPRKSWTIWNKSSKRISMIHREFLIFLIFFFYTIISVELLTEFCHKCKLNHNCFIRETENRQNVLLTNSWYRYSSFRKTQDLSIKRLAVYILFPSPHFLSFFYFFSMFLACPIFTTVVFFNIYHSLPSYFPDVR